MFAKRLLRVFSISVLALLAILLLAVIGLFAYRPSPAEGFAFSSTGKTIQLSDGRTLAYLESGDPNGRPVFYFHGAPGSRLEGQIYDSLNQKLGIRMIVADRPGYGLSDNQENRTYLNWADDVAELADQLAIERFAVLGHSSGGPYAAVVAHQLPERVAVAVIVAGEGPYASGDYPQSVLNSATFNGSGANKIMIWSANHAPWIMRTLFTASRILFFRDPVGMSESEGGFDFEMPVKDKQFFIRDFRHEFSADQIEAFRQGVEGMTRDLTLERVEWPFALEEIHSPTVLVFHGDEDTTVHPAIAEYMCKRITSCALPTIFPGEGHSVLYHRYNEIVQAMLEVWK
jgi:pimeloyl-ACP methyl ester carboxylesterase